MFERFAPKRRRATEYDEHKHVVGESILVFEDPAGARDLDVVKHVNPTTKAAISPRKRTTALFFRRLSLSRDSLKNINR